MLDLSSSSSTPLGLHRLQHCLQRKRQLFYSEPGFFSVSLWFLQLFRYLHQLNSLALKWILRLAQCHWEASVWREEKMVPSKMDVSCDVGGEQPMILCSFPTIRLPLITNKWKYSLRIKDTTFNFDYPDRKLHSAPKSNPQTTWKCKPCLLQTKWN